MAASDRAALVRATSDPAEWLTAGARNAPHRMLLRTPEGRALDYARAREVCDRLAAALVRCGVGPGDRVAVRMEKSPEAVLIYLACLQLGAVFVPINPASTPHELDYLLRDSAARLAVVSPHEHARLAPLAQRAGVARLETLGAAGEGTLLGSARDGDAGAPQGHARGARDLRFGRLAAPGFGAEVCGAAQVFSAGRLPFSLGHELPHV